MAHHWNILKGKWKVSFCIQAFLWSCSVSKYFKEVRPGKYKFSLWILSLIRGIICGLQNSFWRKMAEGATKVIDRHVRQYKRCLMCTGDSWIKYYYLFSLVYFHVLRGSISRGTVKNFFATVVIVKYRKESHWKISSKFILI